jgi:hypothetical protein
MVGRAVEAVPTKLVVEVRKTNFAKSSWLFRQPSRTSRESGQCWAGDDGRNIL